MISLKTRIVFFVTAVIIAISSISVYLVIVYHRGQLEKEFVDRGKTLVVLLSRLAAEGLAVEKMDLINRASYIIKANDVIRVKVYTDIWDVVESYPPDDYENKTDINRAAAYFSNSDAPFYLNYGGTYTFWGKVIYQPYEDFKPITTGFVAIDLSSVRLEKAMDSAIAGHIAAGIFIVIIAVMAVNLLIDKLVLGQVSRLYKSVKEFKKGILPEIQGSYSDDEIGMLTKEFHAMCLALNEKENEIKENMAYLDSILKSSTISIAATDLDFRIKYYNPMAEQIFGYKAEEVIGKTVMEVHTKEKVSNERFERAIDIVKTEGEYRYTVDNMKDGRRRVTDSRVFGIKDNDGNLAGFVLMSTDITDRKEAETRLATQYTITRILVESAGLEETIFRILGAISFSMGWHYAEMWIVDKGSERLRFGGKWCESEGCFQAFDAVSKDMSFAKGEGLPGRVWESEQAAFIHNLTADNNFLRTEAAISDCLVCGFAFPIKSSNEILGVMSFFSKEVYELTDDIKEMFEAIGRQIGGFIERKHTEIEYKVAMQTVMDGFWITDKAGRFLEVNDAYCAMSGYSRSELLKMGIQDVEAVENAEDTKRHIENVIKNGYDRFDSKHRRKDGTIIDLDISVANIQDSDGKLIVFLRDITDRKKADQKFKEYSVELERSNKELEQFAYITSHDLQQPLRVISGFAQLLEKRYKDKLGDEASEFIGYMVQGTERMQRLIKDLLSYSRITTHIKPFKSINSNDVVKLAIMNLQRAIDESGAVIAFENLPMVYADETQMTQLFQNLIDNAIKYRADEKPLIQVSARKSGGEWIFSVADNGIGFDMEQSGRIFNVFQRLHSDSKYEGTGIGLAVCRKIVERHGGRIWADSAKGKGAVFYFSLPFREIDKGEQQ
jgi:PAS domain S-box-containing protein